MSLEYLEREGITNGRVLAAMRSVPRDRFVPESARALADENRPLSIGHGQTISQPYIVAYMTQALAIRSGDRVLEVGTGSGYQCAILAELAGWVYTVEVIPALAERARALLGELGYTNVSLRVGDGAEGWADHAPYDGIIVTAAPADVPPVLVEQLDCGGRMILPVGPVGGYQELVMILKDDSGKVSRKRLLPVRFVPLTHGT